MTHSKAKRGTKVYNTWRGMKDRCNNPNHASYKNYGGRGISYSKSWTYFDVFWEDMGDSYVVGYQLDRIDNNKGYSKENCRWATRRENLLNMRNNVFVDTPLGRMTVSEAAERAGISYHTMHSRMLVGWPTDKIFRKPKCGKRP